MKLFIIIGGCLAVVAIVLVFLLNTAFPDKKFVKYLPAIILIIAGIVLVLVSYWTGTGIGILGLMSFLLGVVVLLIAIIIDTARKY